MAETEIRPHLILPEQFTNSRSFTSYADPGKNKRRNLHRNHQLHGKALQEKLASIQEEYEREEARRLSMSIVDEDFIYVEFISDQAVSLDIDRLDSSRGIYVLLSSREVNDPKMGIAENRVVAMLKKKGIEEFLEKIEEYYAEKDHNSLFANVKNLKKATLRAFWDTSLDGEFPEDEEEIWWEIWLRRADFDKDNREDQKALAQLEQTDPPAFVSPRRLVFPEHIVRLVRATPIQLAESLLLINNLAELRRPRDIADVITDLEPGREYELLEDLINRIEDQTDNDSITVCLIDTGVNHQHPLLKGFTPEENLDSVEPDWGTADGHPMGHGTSMAGLSLYGDLTPILSSSEKVFLYHRLESVKTFNHREEHDPDLYGKVTQEAVERPIVVAPDRQRLYCMAISTQDDRYFGRPSSWSAAMNQITFGEGKHQKLFVVAAGNVLPKVPEDYSGMNYRSSVDDPNQAFNPITVGAFTAKDEIDQMKFPGATALASRGDLSPFSTTSNEWKDTWAIKPDIVMEGGNLAVYQDQLIDPDSLSLLTTAHDFQAKRMFAPFSMTSAASALAARFAAQLWAEHSSLWPETIRALILHSARWTNAMREGKPVNKLEYGEKQYLLRTVGYGVPNLDRAKHSIKNALTLIAQREITPYQFKNSRGATNEMHLYHLPWPQDVLLKLTDAEVRLDVTLSYFIEPNPGNRPYSTKFAYQSHGLRFAMNNSTKNEEEFLSRINRDDYQEKHKGESIREEWILGSELRDKGSIHRDFWVGTAADLATRNLLTIFPVGGWYRKRHKLQRYNDTVRYALIVSIEAPDIELDLYNLIQQQIEIPLSTT